MKKKLVAILMSISALVMLVGSACGADITNILSPGFTVSELAVSPTTAEIGQTVTVTATVTNDGTADGPFYAPLLVDGEAVGVETITVAAGASETVTFSTVMTFGGTYTITLADQTVSLEVTPSTVQNILKMVPASWDAFLYFGAKTLRSDVVTTTDKDGLADLWAIADSYLEYFAEKVELDTGAYGVGEGQLPFTMAQLDYMAFGIGGLATTDFGDEGSLPNMTLMLGLGSTFTATQLSSFLNNFQADWFSTDPPEGGSFVSGTYKDVSTWTPTPAEAEADFPDLLLALVGGDTILFGPAADVQACITVIDTAGDADSLFENDNIREIMGDFGNPVLMAVIDGNVPLPSDEGGDGPSLPDEVAITAGIAMEKSGDTMRLQAILGIGEMGDWLALLTAAIPTPVEMEEQQAAREEEREREDEYWTIQNAIYNLMGDNWMPDGELPNPIAFAGGTATNNMSVFPDVASVATSPDKMWDHNGDLFEAGDKNGWLLFGHDGEATNNQDSLWNYVEGDKVTTQNYYTCEVDGTLRQWSATDVSTATEYTYERYWEDEPETEEPVT